MIVPTVGRIVWYRVHARDGFHPCADDAPCAAIVCGVRSLGENQPGDYMLNLGVFSGEGNYYAVRDVPLIEDGEVPPGCATWMPYQKGQAERTAAAEGALKDPEGSVPSNEEAAAK